MACIAALCHPENGSDLADQVVAGDEQHRKGAAGVAAHNIQSSKNRSWCEPSLVKFFNDRSASIREKASECFRELQSKDCSPLDYARLIGAFIESPAYASQSFSLMMWLEDTHHQVPELTIDICESYFERFACEASDVRSERAADSRTIAKLIYRTYSQHADPVIQARCLDFIDIMCVEGVYDGVRGLDEFER